MSIVSTSLRGALCSAIAVLGAGVVGCGGDEPCEVVCRRNGECSLTAPSNQDCLDLCAELSEDEAYAEALEEQVDCYEEQSCDFIAAGSCGPDFS